MSAAAPQRFAGMEPGRPVGGTYYLYRTLRNLDLEGIRKHLGVDTLGYLSLDGMLEATGINPNSACVACWNEKYPTRITSLAETMHSREQAGAPSRVPVEI